MQGKRQTYKVCNTYHQRKQFKYDNKSICKTLQVDLRCTQNETRLQFLRNASGKLSKQQVQVLFKINILITRSI